MRSPLRFEHVVERNAIVASTAPVDVSAAQRHFNALVHEVELKGREYRFQHQGVLVGRLVPAEQEDNDGK